MKANRVIAFVVTGAALLSGGCVSDGGGISTASSNQPRSATWRCDGGTTMRVTLVGSSVKVLSPRGLDVTLPASPPGQTVRYGEPPYALVFDGREALWFVTGKQPLNCRR